MDTLKLKAQIIDALNLEELTPEDIKDETPLFGPEGLGFDSIDALELLVLLEKNYGIKFTDPSKAKSILVSVGEIARYIEANK
ncbi:MAG: acyl carrier protein [Bacteroidales bacterium]|nr:acyl carrier protein [Bacteroidales bacterium]